MVTLRFFYNEGVESFNRAKAVGHIASQFSNLVGENPTTPQTEDMTQIVKKFESLKTDDNNNMPPTPVGKTISNTSNFSQYHDSRDNRRMNKQRSFGSSGRGHHYHSGGNYYGNRGGYQNKRHYDHGRNNHESNGFKPSTTPTSVISQHSSVHDSAMGESQISNSTEYVTQQVVDYSTTTTMVQQQHQAPQVGVVFPQEYDQANYCVQAPMPYYCEFI